MAYFERRYESKVADETVVEDYGPPGKPSVLVEVPVQRSFGEELDVTRVSYPAADVEPVED